MLSNAVFVAGSPKINIVPKMMVTIMECAMADEEYCTFCVELEDDKYIKTIEKALKKNGYDVEIFEVRSQVDLTDVKVKEEIWISLFYIKVSWKNQKFSFIQKRKEGMKTWIN